MDRETCVRNCVGNQFARFADRLAPVNAAEFFALFHSFEERGYVPKQIVYERMRQELGFSLYLSEALTEDYYRSYPEFCVGFQNMAETLALLRSRSLKLAIVTNASSLVPIRRNSGSGNHALVRRDCHLGSGRRTQAGPAHLRPHAAPSRCHSGRSRFRRRPSGGRYTGSAGSRHARDLEARPLLGAVFPCRRRDRRTGGITRRARSIGVDPARAA